MQNQKQINPSSSVVSSNNNAIVTENNKIYANLNNLKNNGYVVSNWFSFWSIVNIIFSVCWAYWPIKMQEIEVERREWSNFCQPISDCGKSFGGVLIFFALFQLISYIAAIRQKNRSLPPNNTLCFFYLSVLAYCVIIVITIISGIVINRSESGQWCGYESPPFKKEATNFLLQNYNIYIYPVYIYTQKDKQPHTAYKMQRLKKTCVCLPMYPRK